MFRVVIDRDIQKGLEKLPTKVQVKILQYLRTLKSNPYAGKPLQGKYAGRYTGRVWPYRVIYSVNNKGKVVEILDIGTRQGIYK